MAECRTGSTHASGGSVSVSESIQLTTILVTDLVGSTRLETSVGPARADELRDEHFAVLRGVRGDRVYLADPSRGNIRMPVYAFLDTWLQDDGKGLIFVVEPKSGLPGGTMPLSLAGTAADRDRPYPEIMAAREMLTVGNALVRPRPGR